jgi:SAM-dependent methyltransferase
MNAENLGFQTGTFDIAICGFMGWYDCFDFDNFKFTRQDKKAPEIYRALRSSGKFVCCSWDVQEDVTWMEEEILRHYPAILEDHDYLEQRPIGMAYEKALGYELIFRNAGFKDIEISSHAMTFVSTDEEEWWRQMRQLGWYSIMDKIEDDVLQKLKDAIFADLQAYKQADGIYFKKSVFHICGSR